MVAKGPVGLSLTLFFLVILFCLRLQTLGPVLLLFYVIGEPNKGPRSLPHSGGVAATAGAPQGA